MHIVTRMNVGGPAVHVAMLERVLPEDGFEPLIVHGRVGPGEAPVNGRFTPAAGRAVFVRSLGPRIRPLNDVAAFIELLRLVWRVGPDVVHTHTSKAGALGRLAAAACNALRPRVARSLIVHTFHGNVMSGYYGRMGSAVVRGIERCLGVVTDRVVAVSPQQVEELSGRFRIVARAKVVEIPVGADLDVPDDLEGTRDADRARLGLAAEDIAILYAGRLVPVKDLTVLIDAFARTVISLPHARLLLAGDGVCRAVLEARAERLGLAGRVAFLGWRQDMAALYRSCDVGVLTSRNEGTPLFLIEAQAAGLPVVATAVGGVADVIRHEVTGLLVPPGRPDEVAVALIRLGSDAVVRRRFGAAARREVRDGDRFGPARLGRELARLYAAGLADIRGGTALAGGQRLFTLPTRTDDAKLRGTAR